MGLLSFLPDYWTVSYYIHHNYSETTLGVSFSPFAFVLLIAFLSLRIDLYMKYRQKRDIEHRFDQENKQENQIQHWKNKFSKKSKQELISMYDSKDDYNAEAQLAIKLLISEKEAL